MFNIEEKLSILIVTNNQFNFTKLCINAIEQFLRKINHEIIVIDNNSTDGTVQWVENKKEIRLIRNYEDVGIYKAYNQGISIATGKYILFLESSVLITPNSIENLITCISSSNEIAAVSPLSNYGEYFQTFNKEFESFDEVISFSNDFNVSNIDKWEQRLKLSGACFLIKREVINKIGNFDEKFSVGCYGFDDLCFRILNERYQHVLCNDTFVYNYGNLWSKGTINFSAVLKEEENKFRLKWKFSSSYSTGIRFDLIDFVEKNYDKKLNILEIGCACGGTLLKLKSIYKNANLYGIEIDADSSKIASLIADVVNRSIEDEDLEYQYEMFDYIIIGDVLEHLNDPWKVLKNIKRYLKKDGSIITCIPNVMFYGVIRDLLNGNWTYQDSGILDRTHLRFFTLNELKKMFYDAGFTNIECYKKVGYISNETDDFIKKLCELSSPDMREEYSTFQYIIKTIN